MNEHNYLRKIAILLKSGALTPGSVNDVDILHDYRCGIYSDRNCNCDPDIVCRQNGDSN